jgi:two-component system response regulator AtoC
MSNVDTLTQTKSFNIFVVEDDVWYGELLVHHLSLNPDNIVTKFETAKAVLANLHLQPDVITLDYSLPDMNGDELLARIKLESANTSVVIVSGQEDISTAVSLLKKGAYDYVVKNEDAKERLWNTINNIKKNVALQKENDQLRSQISKKFEMQKLIIGNSDQMKKVFSLMEKAIKSQITVSISGETGTGKELVAKAIHHNSDRSKNNFVAVNTSAIPNDLIESELFGHEKGAFTGAITRRLGKFEEANKGTLFLDEIAELDLNLQTKLLRVLQEKEFTRLGGNGIIKTDVRIIVATHKNLLEEVKKGAFREDLYYRLLGLPIHIPPLRDRGNDIILLAKEFLEESCKENKIHKKSFTNTALEKLLSHKYPGNVRELKAIIDLAIIMSENDQIMDTDFNFNIGRSAGDLFDEELTLAEYEEKIIRHYLSKYHNVIEVAKRLGIGKSTIYNLLKTESKSSS